MAHRVAVVAFDGISPFHLAVPGTVLAGQALAPRRLYDVRVCATTPGPVVTDAGWSLHVEHGLEALGDAATVVLPSWDTSREPPTELLDAVRAAHARGARIVGLCLGAFVVAAAGLLDGRDATTHWHVAPELARRHPHVRVRDDVLWTDHGDVVTSAGVAAGLDCCLHLLRTDHGAATAAAVARALVLAPHRDGSQAQYVPTPVPRSDGTDPVARATRWALEHLDEPVDLDTWAASAHLSRRTFTRRFREHTGTSPARWLLHQRLDRARVLLETSDDTVETVARHSGFGSAAALRQHFAARYRTSPQRHRAAFRAVP